MVTDVTVWLIPYNPNPSCSKNRKYKNKNKRKLKTKKWSLLSTILINRKNCAILNASILIIQFLTHSIQMKWINTTSASWVDFCLRPSNWYRWIKLFEIVTNCILLPITFSINLQTVLSKMINWYVLGEL